MDGFDFEASDAIFNDAKDNEEEKIEGNSGKQQGL
jgi:hypothetical protein